MAMNPRLLRPLATGFNPKSIAGLSAWYDATVASSITLASGFVSQWNDLSGAGLHLTQSVEADRPGTGTLNGKTALTFDGSNDYLAVTADIPPATMFCVVEFNAVNALQFPLSVINAAGVALQMVITNLSQLRITSWTGAAASGRSGDNDVAATTPYVVTMNYQADSRYNGKNMAGTDTTVRSSEQGIVVGARRTNNTLSALDGKIGEVIVYNRVLSAAEYVRVERYLAAKWGATLA
jgi:hypothetical protein